MMNKYVEFEMWNSHIKPFVQVPEQCSENYPLFLVCITFSGTQTKKIQFLNDAELHLYCHLSRHLFSIVIVGLKLIWILDV